MTEQEQIWQLAQRIKKAAPATNARTTDPNWWRTPRPYEGNNQDVVRRLAAQPSVPTGEAAREEYFTENRKVREVDENDYKESLTKKWTEKVENELESLMDTMSKRVYEIK